VNARAGGAMVLNFLGHGGYKCQAGVRPGYQHGQGDLSFRGFSACKFSQIYRIDRVNVVCLKCTHVGV